MEHSFPANKRRGMVTLDSEDTISNLPECVLSHLFSFLPSEDARRTSVLSKTWNYYFWTFLTDLDIDDKLLYSKRARKGYFVKFVNGILQHLKSSNLQSFTLSLSNKYNPKHVNAWISSILRQRIQKLHIYYSSEVLLFSCNLFSCSSLLELELKMDACSLRVNPSISLPNLRALKFSGIKFVGDSFFQSKEFVLSFPVLKVFEAKDCKWPNVQSIILMAPLLQSFSLEYPAGRPQQPDENYQPQDESSHHAIKIFSSHLTKFSYVGFLSISEDIILSNAATILDVSFDISSIKKDQMRQIGIRTCMLLKEFSGVQLLKLGHKAVQVLAHANDYVSTLPLFRSLVSLELALHDSLPSQEILLNLLRKTPILQTLVFLSGLANFDNDILSSEEVPHCIAFSLKVVEFKLFDRYRAVLRLGRYVLENSQVLELMSASLCMVDAEDKMKRFRQELLLTPRASSFAVIKVDEMSNKEAKIREGMLYTQGMLTSLSFGEC